MIKWQFGSSMPAWQRLLGVLLFCLIGVVVCVITFCVLQGFLTVSLMIVGHTPISSFANSVRFGVAFGIVMPLTLLLLWPDLRPWDSSNNEMQTP